MNSLRQCVMLLAVLVYSPVVQAAAVQNGRPQPPVVARGDMVSVVVSTAHVTVRAHGMAQQSGNPGDVISVLIPGARRTVTGRISADGVVEASP